MDEDYNIKEDKNNNMNHEIVDEGQASKALYHYGFLYCIKDPPPPLFSLFTATALQLL
jgi:hypothetical protein